MPQKFPPEFKRDVVTIACRGDLTVAEVASDFDISEESVRRWMRQADIDDGLVNGQTETGSPDDDLADALWVLLSVPLWLQLSDDGWDADRYRRTMTRLALAALER